MAIIELYVRVEISDDAASLLDASAMGGAAGTVITLTRNALTNVSGIKRVTVDTAEVAESDGDEIDSAPAVSTPNRPRPAVSVPRKAAPVPTESGRSGRPKTLHGWEAADGGPVREWGQRSPDALSEAGIDVWQVDSEAADTAPAPRPAPKNPATVVQQNSGKRAAAAPVLHKVKSRK